MIPDCWAGTSVAAARPSSKKLRGGVQQLVMGLLRQKYRQQSADFALHRNLEISDHRLQGEIVEEFVTDPAEFSRAVSRDKWFQFVERKVPGV